MSRSPVILVTGALIGVGRAIAIRYGRAWARAGSWRVLGDVGGGDSRVRADGQPDQHGGEQVITLDEVVPHPQYRMCHARSISAPPTAVWDELGQVTMSALPLGYALESIRCCLHGWPAAGTSRWPDGPFSMSHPFRCCSVGRLRS